ncbi:hypothetical protein BaRGS_00035081 [Batillaria attramentaria]|uniref:Uncharacterized protein n=1 Tax=Batillaria attramentaria TaxID=370345 RepID=A0ABD0JG06_9CAEN
MRKFPEKPSFKRWLVFGIKVGLIAEGVCLVGTYWVWHRMNTSQGECGTVEIFVISLRLFSLFGSCKQNAECCPANCVNQVKLHYF